MQQDLVNPRRGYYFAGLVGVCFVLFFAFLSVRDIWDLDEGMHAAIARTMLLTGDWVTPFVNGEPFFDKPVLFNWLNAISFQLFGISEIAARLPAAVSGLGSVLLTWQLGRMAFGERTGFLAGLVLATSMQFLILSRLVQYDMTFTFFTTLAMFCYGVALLDISKLRPCFFGFCIATALAVLTKGPIGLLLPGLAVVAFVLVSRRRVMPRLIDVLPGIAVFTVIVAPWYLLMERANPGYLDYFIVSQHFGNFLGGEAAMKPRHPEPFWYYLPVLLSGMLPWGAALLQSIWRGLRSDGAQAGGLPLFLAVWTLSMLLFFSAATSKLATYVLPVFPAAAILIARYLVTFIEAPTASARRGLLAGIACFLLPIALLAAYAIPADPWSYWEYRSGIAWLRFEAFLVLLVVVLLVPMLLILKKRNRVAAWALAAVSPVIFCFILFLIAPGMNPYKSSRDIAADIDRLLEPGAPIPMHGQFLDSALFYTGRTATVLREADELERFLSSDERRFALVRDRARTEDESFQGDYHVIVRIGNKAIISNRPDPGESN